MNNKKPTVYVVCLKNEIENQCIGTYSSLKKAYECSNKNPNTTIQQFELNRYYY